LSKAEIMSLKKLCANASPLVRSTGKVTFSPFFSAANLGPFVSATKVYSHALNFGYSFDTVINDVTFTGVQPDTSNAQLDCTAPSIIVPTNLNGAISRGPNSDVLCGAFLYGAPYTLTLKGLAVGSFYRASFFHYPWDGAPSGYILAMSESFSLAGFSQDRAFSAIYSIVIYARESTITFNFFNDSHLYALVSEKIS
jgi:hypothetical protein